MHGAVTGRCPLYRGCMYNFRNLYEYMYSEEVAGERREKPTIELGNMSAVSKRGRRRSG